MMELTERKGAEDANRLPKNIRQIGEPGQGMKVLIEDYAYTYLHQLAEENLTCMKTAVLVGRAESQEKVCIRGALEVEMGQEQKKWFSNDHWRNIFQDIQKYFEGMDVIGWFLANPGFPPVLTEELRSMHGRHFPGNQYVFFQMDVLENEEVIYQKGENGLSPLCGYYIYYEKNEQMQAYMSQQRGGIGIEPEGILRDRAAMRFRNVMQEKKEQNEQKKTMAFLYTACTFLVMVVLVIGVTMINNYDRMSNMEHAIHQISQSLDETEELEQAALEENQQALETGTEPVQTEETEEDSSEEQPEEVSAEEEQSVEEQPEEKPAEEEQPMEEVQEAVSENVQEPLQYQVKEGDTLLDICRKRYGDEQMLEEICERNGLDDSDKIYVGQTIELP